MPVGASDEAHERGARRKQSVVLHTSVRCVIARQLCDLHLHSANPYPSSLTLCRYCMELRIYPERNLSMALPMRPLPVPRADTPVLAAAVLAPTTVVAVALAVSTAEFRREVLVARALS